LDVSQHPVGHVVALHLEFWQKPYVQDAFLPEHVTQLFPPLPQSVIVSPGWQMSSASQHPSGQVVGVHVAPWHTPATHESPDAHASQAAPPVPHAFRVVPVWHTPEPLQQPVGQVEALHAATLQLPAVQLSPDGHAVQVAPPVPHAAFVLPGWQTPVMSQQPVGHVMALQVDPLQAPPTQVSVDGQVAHVAPPVPQNAVVVPASQIPVLSQQPVGQLAALQGGGLQVPALHVSPVGHAVHVAPPVPHALELDPVSQKPSVSQHPVGHVMALHATPTHAPARHASPGGHGSHGKPPAPQAEVLVPASHLPALSQQPVMHVRGLHVRPSQAPVRQASPVGQASHACPPLPQAVVLVPGWHVPDPSQHPVGHVETLHGVVVQVPPLHVSPVGQDVHALPPVPQAEVLVPVSQKPSASQHPFGQLVALHVVPLQIPPVQVSPVGQGRHAPPPVPHAEVLVPDSHLPRLSQHPVGQVIALHVVP
jgi:hypothetical protein